MKHIKNSKLFISILALSLMMTNCGNDDNTTQEEDPFAGCCSTEPVFGENVNNLDESAGEIIVYNLFTPNGDGTNDRFGIENIGLYANHIVSIYDINDQLLFESTNYGSNANELFPTEPQGQFGLEGITPMELINIKLL